MQHSAGRSCWTDTRYKTGAWLPCAHPLWSARMWSCSMTVLPQTSRWGQAIDVQRVQECLQAANLAEHVAALPHGMGHCGRAQRHQLSAPAPAPGTCNERCTKRPDPDSRRSHFGPGHRIRNGWCKRPCNGLMQGRTTLVIATASPPSNMPTMVVGWNAAHRRTGNPRELLAQDGLYARLQARPGLTTSAPVRLTLANGLRRRSAMSPGWRQAGQNRRHFQNPVDSERGIGTLFKSNCTDSLVP